MRICHINTQFKLGGAETVMHQLHDGLKAHGHDCRIAVAHAGRPRLPYGYNVTRLYPRGLERLRYTRLAHLVEKWFPHSRWVDQSFRKLGRVPADVFHVHSFTGYASSASLAELARQQSVVWTLHCFWGWQSEGDMPDEAPLQQAALGLAPQFLRNLSSRNEIEEFAGDLKCLLEAPICAVVPSAYAKREMLRVPAFQNWQIEHIPNGVDPSRFRGDRKGDSSLRQQLGLTPGSTVLLVVNRDYKILGKGYPMIREALQAQQLGPDVEIVLIGIHAQWAADQLKGTQARVHAVEFISERQKLAEYFEAADVFLFASLRENFPCVTLEAMAAGCCVVATPTDGVKEQVENFKSGYLAETLTGEALAVALRAALGAEASIRRRVGEEGRARVSAEFSESRMVDKYLELYQARTRKN